MKVGGKGEQKEKEHYSDFYMESKVALVHHGLQRSQHQHNNHPAVLALPDEQQRRSGESSSMANTRRAAEAAQKEEVSTESTIRILSSAKGLSLFQVMMDRTSSSTHKEFTVKTSQGKIPIAFLYSFILNSSPKPQIWGMKKSVECKTQVINSDTVLYSKHSFEQLIDI